MLKFKYKKTSDGSYGNVISYSDNDASLKLGNSTYDNNYGFTFVDDDKLIPLTDNLNVTDNEFPAFIEEPTVMYNGNKNASLNFTDQDVLFDGMTLKVENQSNFIFTVTCENSSEDVIIDSKQSRIVQYLSVPNRFIEFAGGNTALTVSKDDTAKTITINGNTLDLHTWFNGLAPDTDKPTTPTNIQSSSIGDTTASLSWTASTDNAGVIGYDVYVNGVLTKSVTGNSATLTGLTPDTNYSITIKAKDSANNYSDFSQATAFKTLQVTSSIKSYSGFYNGATIDEVNAKTLTIKQVSNPLTNWHMTQDGQQSRYSYIILPTLEASKVNSVKTQGGLPGNWNNQSLTIDSIAYTAIRSPYKMWDENVTFVTE
ncbi:hypothetical protein M1M25_gp089 [Tenacibaculum phage Gundel_1]|uniref:Fibronectin type-III domain-containing protein n=1 Tax=Tenacibaculum phage Gundel_1 TaxID=2745672 RepID=A0A8E5EBM5_9CAUD|nr:hypothetical protein M1M25_gp089 [Tenacibaculum phage Gundel_1]QQV91526.1 hypothetical protein Gundel1_89 [Tenacibaculum phage Gundel_1]